MMKAYRFRVNKKRRWSKIFTVLGIVIALLGVGGLVGARYLYNQNLRAVSTSAEVQEVVYAVPKGATLDEIAKGLKDKQLIRAAWAFTRYVRSNELSDSLQAGTYKFQTSQDVASIVKDLVDGKVDVQLFTIFPTQRLDEIRKSLIDDGKFSAKDVDAALSPSRYADHPALVDKPTASSLEGYLYPDSYQRVAETKPETIVSAALDEMAEALTPEIRAGIARQGLSVHEGIIIASIVEQEIPAEPLAPKADRRQAAQVFLKRKSMNIELGSDMTAFYGAAVDGVADPRESRNVFYPSPYNTRLNSGMPPGPIGNVTKDGLDCVAFPADTDFLYFVSGDGEDFGNTYFSKTLAEHEALTAKHCKSCGR